MASVGEFGTKTKGLNPDINLVPFIDLLSVCICFLLVSAVWLQIEAVPVKQSHGTAAPTTEQNQVELSIQFSDALSIIVNVKKNGSVVESKKISAPNDESFVAQLSQALDQDMAFIRQDNTLNNKSTVSSATIEPSANAPYKNLILVMAELRKRQIVNLAVIPKAD